MGSSRHVCLKSAVQGLLKLLVLCKPAQFLLITAVKWVILRAVSRWSVSDSLYFSTSHERFYSSAFETSTWLSFSAPKHTHSVPNFVVFSIVIYVKGRDGDRDTATNEKCRSSTGSLPKLPKGPGWPEQSLELDIQFMCSMQVARTQISETSSIAS